MFNTDDFEQLNNDYFDTITLSDNHIIIKSKNSGHTWDLQCSDWYFGRQIRVYHKHNDADWFHEQPKMHPKTIEQAQKYIMHHDEWFCQNKKKKAKKVS